MELKPLPRVLYPIFKSHIEQPENADRKFVLNLYLKSGKTWRGAMLTSKEDLKAFGVIELQLWPDKKFLHGNADRDGPTGDRVVIDCEELEAASIEWVS
ncbi:hypothetical protein A8H39_01915 [Paraburkholderia fungorum]|uniref:hypothetical protein n=1 Tax=Paraburkholderia fungorum TaxID=134537 RepID=UPI0004827351|nr:hypothetical protein [Paraburkholderia fungorum]MBB5546595.1 hypothetical protein [Paraburkholderia fungorum]PNE59928.1 hypothetical protein A8H39_01915 [Paraburkholderia fungorum]